MNSNRSMPDLSAPQGSTGARKTIGEHNAEQEAHRKATREQVKTHIHNAQVYYQKALKSEAKANARAAKLVGQAERNVEAGQPLLGGQTAKDVGDLRASSDPVWKGHAADNRWHLERSRTEAANAQMLIAAMREGIFL